MKLLFAIVNNDDASSVNSGLSGEGFPVTKIASTGGFLKSGNTTFLVGVKDEQVEEVVEIIKRFSKKRVVPMPPDPVYTMASVHSAPAKITIGGATVFILDVERYLHL